MFYSDNLKNNNIKHCFFSRKNGTSRGIYESLNCGIGSKDKKETVQKNLELVAKAFNIEKKQLMLMIKTHRSKVQFIDCKNNESLILIHKDAARVGIGTVSASAKLEISSSLSENIFLAGNASGSITVNKEGIIKISDFDGTPTITSGGLYYSSSNFFVGI